MKRPFIVTLSIVILSFGLLFYAPSLVAQELPDGAGFGQVKRETESFFNHQDTGISKIKNHPPESKNGFIQFQGTSPNDGILTAKLTLGKRPDFSLLFRASFPDDLAEVNGYSVSVDSNHIQIHRWEEGYALPVTIRHKLSSMPKQITIQVKMTGIHYEATVYNDKQKVILQLSFDDAAFSGTEFGWRVYKKQDPNTTLDDVEFIETDSKAAFDPKIDSKDPNAYIRQHPKAYLIVPQNAQNDEKSSLLKKCTRLKNSIIVDHDIYRCDHETMIKLVDESRHLPEGWYWSEPRNSFIDGEYRVAAQDLKCTTPMWCNKSMPLTPNRSAKDAAMVQAYLDNYVTVCQKTIKNVRLETIGKSWMGHDIRAIVLSNMPDDKPKPRVLFNGAHHGIELLATDFAFDVLEYLCEKTTKSSPEHTKLLQSTEVWIIPTVNLDGLDLFFHVSDHLGRKNGHGVFQQSIIDNHWPKKIGPVTPGEGYYRYLPNAIDVGAGVDINRNYPLRFGATGELSSSARRRDYWYRGAYASSEPEIQAMMNLFHTEQFVGSISFHTVSTRILSPYSIDALQNPPHEKDPAWQLALKMAESAGEQASGGPYQVVKNLYSVDGTDQDWFRMVSGTMAYLIEGALHNPTGEKRTNAVDRNRNAWLTFFNAMPHATIARVRDSEGNPLIAEVSYSDVPALNGEHWMTRCEDGTHTMYCTKERQITVTLPDGTTQTQTVKCSSNPQLVDFTFERPKDYTLEKAACANGLCDNHMMSVDALCDLKENQCPRLPAQRYCYINDTCLPAGLSVPMGFFGTVTCDPREDPLHWTISH